MVKSFQGSCFLLVQAKHNEVQSPSCEQGLGVVRTMQVGDSEREPGGIFEEGLQAICLETIRFDQEYVVDRIHGSLATPTVREEF
jgi:hypothetical protein